MAYNKRIRGNDNVASEEFSHNRVFVDLGISGLVFSLFAVLLITSAIIWMIARQGGLLSILVILTFIGIFLGGLIVGLCFIAVTISKTIQQVQVNKILAQTVVAGEIVAYRNSRDEWDHLSAEHERAKVIPQFTVSAAEHEPLPSEAYTVIDMHRQGIGFKKIAEATLWSEYAVRKLCNQIDGKGEP